MGVREAVGRALGAALAPLAWGGSFVRGARVFHPEGVVYAAEVRPLSSEGGDIGELGQRLSGPALVRLSGGVWRWRGGKGEEMPDVLGVSIRFRSSREITPEADPGDQDLLFLSFRYLLELPIAPLLTNWRDFLANTYYGVLPFEVANFGKAELRLVPLRAASAEGNRREKLERAVAACLAVFRLEVRQAVLGAPWLGVADIILRERVDVDQRQLLFDPFRTGRGIVPSGLIQATRAAVYKASFMGRRFAALLGR